MDRPKGLHVMCVDVKELLRMAREDDEYQQQHAHSPSISRSRAAAAHAGRRPGTTTTGGGGGGGAYLIRGDPRYTTGTLAPFSPADPAVLREVLRNPRPTLDAAAAASGRSNSRGSSSSTASSQASTLRLVVTPRRLPAHLASKRTPVTRRRRGLGTADELRMTYAEFAGTSEAAEAVRRATATPTCADDDVDHRRRAVNRQSSRMTSTMTSEGRPWSGSSCGGGSPDSRPSVSLSPLATEVLESLLRGIHSHPAHTGACPSAPATAPAAAAANSSGTAPAGGVKGVAPDRPLAPTTIVATSRHAPDSAIISSILKSPLLEGEPSPASLALTELQAAATCPAVDLKDFFQKRQLFAAGARAAEQSAAAPVVPSSPPPPWVAPPLTRELAPTKAHLQHVFKSATRDAVRTHRATYEFARQKNRMKQLRSCPAAMRQAAAAGDGRAALTATSSMGPPREEPLPSLVPGPMKRNVLNPPTRRPKLR